MKKQILMLVIGILIGAIIATGVFLVLKEDSGKQMDKSDRRQPPTSADGNFVDDGRGRWNRKNDDNNDVKQETTTDSNESNV